MAIWTNTQRLLVGLSQNGNEAAVMTFTENCRKHFASSIQAALMGMLRIFQSKEEPQNMSTRVSCSKLGFAK